MVVVYAHADADGICDDVDDCVGDMTSVEYVTETVAIYECGWMISQRATVTVTESQLRRIRRLWR